MSTFNEIFLGGARKSIQRGTVSVPPSGLFLTIAAVNPAKTELRFLGAYHGGGSTFDDISAFFRLIGPTTIQFHRAGAAGTVNVSWELTEYY